MPGGIRPDRLGVPPPTTEGELTTIYVVKTCEQFLCCAEDSDIGMAPAIEGAKSFRSYEEAEIAANEHADPNTKSCRQRHHLLTLSMPLRPGEGAQ